MPIFHLRNYLGLLVIFSGLIVNRSQAQSLSTSTSLQITLQPAGEIISSPNVGFILNGTAFGTFNGSTTITFYIRTDASGSGTVTMQFNSDFSAGGPLIANGDLSYQCTSANYGTACSGTIVPSLNTSYTIDTIGASACTGGGTPCSSLAPTSVAVSFSLPDKVSFKVGSYSTTGTVTISAL